MEVPAVLGKSSSKTETGVIQGKQILRHDVFILGCEEFCSMLNNCYVYLSASDVCFKDCITRLDQQR